MILWTIRHTKPHNPAQVCYGRLDFDVSPSFAEEFPGPVAALKTFGAKPEVFYSSPLLRCRRLAEKVSEAVKLAPTYASEIQEVNFGTWEGVQLDKVPASEMAAWRRDLRGYQFPGGESFYQVDARVSGLLERCLESGRETLWVTHAGVIASLMHTYAGVEDGDFVEGRFPYALVTKFNFQRQNGKITATFENVYGGLSMQPLDV